MTDIRTLPPDSDLWPAGHGFMVMPKTISLLVVLAACQLGDLIDPASGRPSDEPGSPPAVSASQSNVAAAPDEIEPGETSTITVTARDANGNPVSGATVELSASGPGNNTLTQPGPTDANGVATGTFSSEDAGEKTVSAEINGVTLSRRATVRVTVPPAPPPPPPNRPPQVDAGQDETVLALFYTLRASFSDPDNDGPWSFTINWGDGKSETGTASSQGTINRTHTYPLLGGTFTVRVTVVDSHGASGSDEVVVTVLVQ